MSNIEQELIEFSMYLEKEGTEHIATPFLQCIREILYKLPNIPGYASLSEEEIRGTIFGELLVVYEGILSDNKLNNIVEELSIDTNSIKERYERLLEMKKYLLSVNELTYDEYEAYREQLIRASKVNEIFGDSYLDLTNSIATNFLSFSLKFYDFLESAYNEFDPHFQYLSEGEKLSIYEKDTSTGYNNELIFTYFFLSLFDFVFVPLEKELNARMEELELPEEIRSALEIQKKAMEAQKDAIHKMEEIKQLQYEHSKKFGGSFLDRFFNK